MISHNYFVMSHNNKINSQNNSQGAMGMTNISLRLRQDVENKWEKNVFN